MPLTEKNNQAKQYKKEVYLFFWSFTRFFSF